MTVPSPWWPLPVLCFSCQCWSGPLQAEGVEATWSLHVLSGEELGESPAHNAGQPTGVWDMLPTSLQVDREVMVRTEEGRELPRAGFHSARPGRIYGKPASGIGAVDQVGGNRGGPWAPAPGPTTQAHYGDIPRTEKKALDFRSQRLWHSYALAPTPAVRAACGEDSACQVCWPWGQGGLARAGLSSLSSWQF